jgi:hypothetical protein
MHIQLRIPIYIFLLGIFSGVYQIFHENVDTGNSLVNGLLFYILIGVTIYFLEKTTIIKKEIHIIIAVLIVGMGIIIDLLLI